MATRRDALLKGFDENRFFMRTTVERNIAAHRKGRMRLRLMDAEGRPLSGAQVAVDQMGHDFNFGCNIFLLDEMETEEKNLQYREKFREIFNYAIIPFYWKDLEPERGKPRYVADSYKVYRRPAPDLALEYCDENGLRRKGHCLIYHSFTPLWMPEDVPTQKRLTEEHLREVAGRYAGRIQDWDVENENLCSLHFDRFRLYEEPDYLEWCFTAADRAFTGGNRLFINEASFIWNERVRNGHMGVRSPYYMQIARLLAAGKRVDCIGMQFHQFIRKEDEMREDSLPFDPVKLYEVMDCYARFGRPLHVSEITIPAYEGSPEEEDVQMELTKNLYRTWFSHPAMDGIIWWNLVDGYAVGAPRNTRGGENYYSGGLLRYDMAEKPAYAALRELVQKEWHTKEALCTNERGEVEFEGFFGEYALKVNGLDAGRFHLARASRPEKEIRLQ